MCALKSVRLWLRTTIDALLRVIDSRPCEVYSSRAAVRATEKRTSLKECFPALSPLLHFTPWQIVVVRGGQIVSGAWIGYALCGNNEFVGATGTRGSSACVKTN